MRVAIRFCWLCVLLLGACGAYGEERVAFLPKPPVIDGALDVPGLEPHQFPVVIADGNKAAVKPTYRIAYGTGFFYLYIEMDDANVVTRDRAYQNGDGFQLALTMPRTGDAPTDEFYVMGFTVSDSPTQPWQKKFVWYRNVDLQFTRLQSAQIATRVADGKTGIELLLPWREVYPYHPWLGEIGFNLCYVKVTGEKDKTYFFVVQDDRLQSEQSPRKYERLTFASPTLAEGTQAYAILQQNHAMRGQTVEATVAVTSATSTKLDLGATIWSGEGTPLTTKRTTVANAPGLTIRTIPLPTATLPAGGYTISWSEPIENPAARIGLSILPEHDPQALNARLNQVANRIAPGSLTTMQFRLQEIENASRQLKPYDVATSVRSLLADFLDAVAAAEQGRDLIATRAGAQRRAYRSKVDVTLQPYTVRVPAAVTGCKAPCSTRWPLVVYLHGSGEDDRGTLRDGFLPDNVIQLAPRGRGTSNAYSADHAQDDIREAIEDVIANYPVDPKRIVLSGFSMGGYGVYRTFYEDPTRYRALAIFSGHPNIARQYLGGEHPNFLDADSLRPFRGRPMFIFHGGKDRNCPIELTRELLGKLEAAGAQVQFAYAADKGHEAPSEATLQAFHEWLQRVLQ